MISQLNKAIQVQLSSNTLFKTPTIASLSELVTSDEQTEQSLPFVLVEIQAGNPQKRPLYLVHPAGGQVHVYLHLARSLGTDQPVYGLQAQSLDGKTKLPIQIEEMAANYVEVIRAHQPEGPYLLGGASFGGLVAYEMAQQIQKQGQQIALLCMLDTPNPTNQPAPILDDVDILTAVVMMDGNASVSLDNIRQLSFDEQLEYFVKHVKKVNLSSVDVAIEQLRQFFQIYKTELDAMWRYQPKTYQGQLILFTACERDTVNLPNLERGWFKLITDGIKVHEVPGNHFTMHYSPNVEVMAENLNEYLIKVENKLTYDFQAPPRMEA